MISGEAANLFLNWLALGASRRDLAREKLAGIVELAKAEARVLPPSEPELAGIAERYAQASRHVTGEVDVDWEQEEDGPRTYHIGDEEQTIAYLLLDHPAARMRVGEFLAGAFADVPRLLAAIAERDGILHDLQNDPAMAYAAGEAAGRAWAVRLVRARCEGHRARQKEFMATNAVEPDLARRWAAMNEFQADTLDGLLTDLGTSPHDPLPELGTLPPDRARTEVLRLREALRRIGEVVAASGSRVAGKVEDMIGEALEGKP